MRILTIALLSAGIGGPVGGAVAGVVSVAVIIIIACYVVRRRKGEKDTAAWRDNTEITMNIRHQVSRLITVHSSA